MAIVARDYYLVLGVTSNADAAALRDAYDELVAQLEEDAATFDEEFSVADLRREIDEAYHVLSDPVRRHHYDQLRQEPEWWCELDDHEPVDEPDDDNAEQLRSLIHRYLVHVSQRSPNEVVDMQLPFEIAALGGQARIRLPVRAACPDCSGLGGSHAFPCTSCSGEPGARPSCTTCRGNGWQVRETCRQCSGRGWVGALGQAELRIPSGVTDGTLLPFPGSGSDDGERETPDRPHFIRVKVTRHPFFSRRGHDILCQVPLSEKAAREGKTITVRTIRGRRHSVVVPPHSQNGDVVRLEGEGLEFEGRRGDQLIEIKVNRSRKSGGKS